MERIFWKTLKNLGNGHFTPNSRTLRSWWVVPGERNRNWINRNIDSQWKLGEVHLNQWTIKPIFHKNPLNLESPQNEYIHYSWGWWWGRLTPLFHKRSISYDCLAILFFTGHYLIVFTFKLIYLLSNSFSLNNWKTI